MLDRNVAVIRHLLERNAGEAPDEVSVRFEGGVDWTRQDCLDAAYEAGNYFRAAGVGRGDRVAIFLPNGESFIRAWWGLCSIGAVAVPINPVFRGAMLARILTLANLTAMVVDDDLRVHVDEEIGIPVITPELLRGGDRSAPRMDRPIEAWDTMALILTSGTTGPSKLVTVTYMYFALGGGIAFYETEGLGRDDVFLADLPMFHMAALCYIGGSLVTRTKVAIRLRPDLANYWQVARDVGATAGLLLSTMTNHLVSRPPSPVEREHGMRVALMSPLPADPDGFRERFGIDVLFTTFGMSEAPTILRGYAGEASAGPGYCGQVYPGYEVRLVDEHDIEVEAGATGELVARTNTPWIITPGYYGDREATAEAWRNGWFHTGDVFRRDQEGNFYFLDRAKDALRRRGEMISAFEVERVVTTFDGVREAACVAYPSDAGADDDVKVFVVSTSSGLDHEQLLRFCAGNMPHYMVPRYIELIDELPKTATLRVQKVALRERGNGPLTWDREAYGLGVTRRGIGSLVAE